MFSSVTSLEWTISLYLVSNSTGGQLQLITHTLLHKHLSDQNIREQVHPNTKIFNKTCILKVMAYNLLK